MRIGEVAVLTSAGLDGLITTLVELGYETKGPVVRDGADHARAGEGDG